MMGVHVRTAGFEAVDKYFKARGKMPVAALDRGLRYWAIAAARRSIELLSGSGGDAAGSYPVPVRTGHLRRSENYVGPNQDKIGISTGHGQAVLVNSAIYASAIHDGSMATKDGAGFMVRPRKFHDDAIEQTRSAGIEHMLVQVRKELAA